MQVHKWTGEHIGGWIGMGYRGKGMGREDDTGRRLFPSYYTDRAEFCLVVLGVDF